MQTYFPDAWVNAVVGGLESASNSVAASDMRRAQAIVVLGGRPSRAAKAAQLQRETGLPVYVAGPEDLLELTLRNVPPRWIDSLSLNTETSAAAASCTLLKANIRTVVLVTDSWHMARASRWFRWYGFDVIPVATAIASPAEQKLAERRLHATHELGGLIEFEFRSAFKLKLLCRPQGTGLTGGPAATDVPRPARAYS